MILQNLLQTFLENLLPGREIVHRPQYRREQLEINDLPQIHHTNRLQTRANAPIYKTDRQTAVRQETRQVENNSLRHEINGHTQARRVQVDGLMASINCFAR